MKLRIFTLATCFVLVLVACHTSKKTVVTTTTVNSTTTTNTVAATSTNTAAGNTTLAAFVPADPNAEFAAGDKELKAIQIKFPEVTSATLSEGQRIYTGPCTKCHGTAKMKIYKRSEESWQHEINAMAPKARITDTEKDALWKYILAMRATHPETK